MTIRILLTNDDGIGAPGIRALAAAIHEAAGHQAPGHQGQGDQGPSHQAPGHQGQGELGEGGQGQGGQGQGRRAPEVAGQRVADAGTGDGYELVVAAPQYETSGASASLTAVTQQGRIIFERVDLPGLPGVPAYGVSASPAYIAVLAGLGTFGPPPDLVLSGINRGANAGHAVLHSGTVGAALTAANNGVRAMAVSLDVLSPAAASAESGGAAIAAIDTADDEARHWATAAAFARTLLPGLPDLPAGTVLNLNVPDLPEDRVRGLRQTGLAPFGQVLIALAETGADYVRTAIEENGARQIPGTDLALLAEGWAAVTPIRSIGVAEDVTVKW